MAEIRVQYKATPDTLQDLQWTAPLVDQNGRIRVSVDNLTPGTSSFSLGKAEDAPHTSGDVGVMFLGVRNDSNGSLSGTDLDYTPLALDASGRIRIGNGIATDTSSLAKNEDNPHVSGDVGVAVWAVRNDNLASFSGTDLDYTPIAVNAAGQVRTTIEKNEDAGHNSGDLGVMSLGVRNDAGIAFNGTDLDYTPIAMSSSGQVITKDWATAAQDWSYVAAASGILNTTTAVTVKAAAAAGIKNYITGMDIMAEALGAATEFAIRDGAAGTVIYRTKIPATGIPTGRTIQFLTPIKGSAATLLEVVTLTASVTGAVYVNLQGYTGP